MNVTALRPNLYVIYPVHIDYPLFRHNLNKFKSFFSHIFVGLTNLNQENNYRTFIINRLPFATIVKPSNKELDWRNDITRPMLTLYPINEYCVFWEQDFLIKSHRFFERLFEKDHNFVYYKEGGRIHPAFCLVKREILDKTSKDFSAYPDEGMDHFGKFFNEVQAIDKGENLVDLGFRDKDDFYHVAGVTQNYYCHEMNQPFHKHKEFLCYNYQSMLLPHQIPEFYKKELEIAEKYGCVEEENFLTEFFPEE